MKSHLIAADHNHSWDAIKEAHRLSYNPRKLEQYYDTWSGDYDTDVSNEDYSGPKFIADYLAKILENDINQDMNILDAGCGTGLVGIALAQKGFRSIHGFDLSYRMVEKAEQTGVYTSLEGGCDMTCTIEAYQDNQYEVTVCCGVFTSGHVYPNALEELIRITKPEGLLLISTRKSYYENTDFQTTCDRLQEEGKVQLIDSVMDGPYIAEEGAHYWAFAIC
ncbi:MAG: class I SAM-dependent methyltransferase [Scytonema sp. PMC 1069.18]|nr:class I SAM-dependent methyltransferase [Scytonema sp. PMC 1069.18]MEC4883682.1 class I SAM-dependent methyltransferase [Scytonema sp. PMC 1070.18]